MKIVLMSVLVILMTSASYAAYGQTNPLTIVDLADGTKILADARGMTVYLFDVDVDSESKCYDACEKAGSAAFGTLLLSKLRILP